MTATRNNTGTTKFETPSDTEVRFSRTFDASVKLAYEVYTKPEHLRKWLLGPGGWTMPICEIEARAGGSWRYGWRKDTGEEMVMGGKVLEAVPGVRLVQTEQWGPEWPETHNVVEFKEANGMTTITTTIRYPSKDARDAAIKTGMGSGLDESYARLDALFAALA